MSMLGCVKRMNREPPNHEQTERCQGHLFGIFRWKGEILWLRISINVKPVVLRSILKQSWRHIIAQCIRSTNAKLAEQPSTQRASWTLTTATCIRSSREIQEIST